MKFLKSLIFVVLICYIIAIGYNVMEVYNLDDQYIEKNSMSLTLEVASRLGLVQTLGVIGDLLNTNNTDSILQNNQFLREFVNVLFDWYAPIKFSPVLSISKEVGWLLFQNRLNN